MHAPREEYEKGEAEEEHRAGAGGQGPGGQIFIIGGDDGLHPASPGQGLGAAKVAWVEGDQPQVGVGAGQVGQRFIRSRGAGPEGARDRLVDANTGIVTPLGHLGEVLHATGGVTEQGSCLAGMFARPVPVQVTQAQGLVALAGIEGDQPRGLGVLLGGELVRGQVVPDIGRRCDQGQAGAVLLVESLSLGLGDVLQLDHRLEAVAQHGQLGGLEALHGEGPGEPRLGDGPAQLLRPGEVSADAEQ